MSLLLIKDGGIPIVIAKINNTAHASATEFYGLNSSKIQLENSGIQLT